MRIDDPVDLSISGAVPATPVAGTIRFYARNGAIYYKISDGTEVGPLSNPGYSSTNPPPYPVTSVFGRTGAITLGVSDLPSTTMTTDTTQTVSGLKTFSSDLAQTGPAKITSGSGGLWEGVNRVYSPNNPPPAGTPSNMLTTDTAQTITGVKTFATGSLFADDLTGTAAQLNIKSLNNASKITVVNTGVNFFGITTQFGGGTNVIGITNVTTAPNVSPSGGLALYAENGVLKYRGSGASAIVLDGSATPPTNMATTDTAQNITAIKTHTVDLLQTGAAKMVSGTGGVWDGVNRVYSDSNPPDTLMMSFVSNTNPPLPAPGEMVLSLKRKAQRTLLSQLGPSGLDTTLQPAFFANSIHTWRVQPGLTTATIYNFGAVTTLGTASAQAASFAAGGSFYAGINKVRYTTTATTAGTAVLWRTTPFLGRTSTANIGGYYVVIRFGLGITTATNRVAVGLSPLTANQAGTVDPIGGMLNFVGIGVNAAQTSFTAFCSSGASGTNNTQVALGANFPVTTAATDFYELRLFAPSGDVSQIGWSLERLNTGNFTEGVFTTTLPVSTNLVSPYVWHSNGTTAANAALDIQSVYVETDN